jgi:hypothetical protein
MNRYRLTGEYGTFTVTKEIKAVDYDEAYAETGIMMDLEDLGWSFADLPEGEAWLIEELQNGEWVEVIGQDSDGVSYGEVSS